MDREFSYRLSRAYLFNANANGAAIARGFSSAVMFFVQVYALRSGMLFQGIPLQGVYADLSAEVPTRRQALSGFDSANHLIVGIP